MTPDVLLTLAALSDILQSVVFVVFVLVALLLTLVILVQEGKGGGIGAAFGGAAADAFGVKAGTVNRFTAYLAAGFLGLALLYAGLSERGNRVRVTDPAPAPVMVPEDPAIPPSDLPPSDLPPSDVPPSDAPPSGGTPPPAAPGAPEGGTPEGGTLEGGAPAGGAPAEGAPVPSGGSPTPPPPEAPAPGEGG